MNPPAPAPQNQFQMPAIYPHYYTPPPINQIPNSNPNYTSPSSSALHLPVYVSGIQPPGVVSTHQHQHFPPPSISCYEAAQAAAAAAYQQQIQEWQAAQFHHNPDAVVGISLTSAATEGTSTGTVPALNPSAQQAYPVAQPPTNGTALNKGSKKNKKTKVVQSAYCDVCKIECTSREALGQHRSGKKHKKTLEKVNEARRIAAQPSQPIVIGPPPPVVVTAPVIGPQEKPSKKKKAALSSNESLDTKRRKLLDGGTAVEAVKICKECNVVCNSQTVYNYHLAGHKHAAMLKKLSAAGTIVT
ncbi:hypothetical protein MKW94_019626 [Papaver nudicaule]|uniref:Uncharacterized protein n=1 Tax=Papaver nudicaule TaxID=74823 RepID=A0AA42AWY6_PAPNU|nr:hypothetical protein [Papaver nudicaule]